MMGLVLLSGPYMEHIIGALVILVAILFAAGAAIRTAFRGARETDAAEHRRRDARPL